MLMNSADIDAFKFGNVSNSMIKFKPTIRTDKECYKNPQVLIILRSINFAIYGYFLERSYLNGDL